VVCFRCVPRVTLCLSAFVYAVSLCVLFVCDCARCELAETWRSASRVLVNKVYTSNPLALPSTLNPAPWGRRGGGGARRPDRDTVHGARRRCVWVDECYGNGKCEVGRSGIMIWMNEYIRVHGPAPNSESPCLKCQSSSSRRDSRALKDTHNFEFGQDATRIKEAHIYPYVFLHSDPASIENKTAVRTTSHASLSP
jgi:hypothetical protein